MKIVYISTSTIPSRTANSIHVMKMCQAFAGNGHEVVLIAPDKKDDMESGVDHVYSFYGVENCFEIVKLSWLPIKGRGYIYGLMAGWKAIGLKPDLVYCRNIPGCFFVSKFGLPVVFESHFPAEDSGMLSEWMFKKVIKSPFLQKLVVITRALKAYYETNYPQVGANVQVAPDAADPLPRGIQPIELPNRGVRLQVGYVGHLYKGKGMEVVSQLAELCPWTDFHVVGGTERDIEYWKNTCSDNDNLSCYGHIPHAEVVKYMQAFDMVLLPNQHKVVPHGDGGGNIGQWTSPLKVFEYMAAVKPIIASDLPILREILKHDHNALLCPPDDISAWLKALVKLQKEPGLRDKLGNNAYNDFVKNYTWKARAEKLLFDMGGSDV